MLSLLLLLIVSSACAEEPLNHHPTPSCQQVASFADLDRLAADLAARPYQRPQPLLKALAELEYEQYREIQFKPEKGIWWNSESPFSLETFHRGFVQTDRVALFTIDDRQVTEIPFSPSNFDYRTPLEDVESLVDCGHAGVKVVGRFAGSNDAQEMLTFLGSSYFRARSGQTVYGTSARGLAVDIGLPRDEEFPAFKAFWIFKPEPGDSSLKALALLDSPSVSGAYQFELTPGNDETGVRVECSLHFREPPEKIGLAPLTSMWIWGDGLDGPPLDRRPAVHDSDGLLVETAADGWIWRAFARQDYPSVSTIAVDDLRGFGLLQRNRAFYHFDDHNAQYHKRPSVWVQPTCDDSENAFSQGHIELLELPGAHEGVDNIAAYWVPNQKPKLDEPLRLSYDVRFFPGDLAHQDFVARATNLDVRRRKEVIVLKTRFSGEAIRDMAKGTITIDERLVRGIAVSKSLEPTDTGDWIATLVIKPSEQAPVEVSLRLMDENRYLSERFDYLCPPTEPTFMYPQVYTRKE